MQISKNIINKQPKHLAMSPRKKYYRAPDGACDFSSMTFVIVSQKKSPQGKVICPCGGIVSADLVCIL